MGNYKRRIYKKAIMVILVASLLYVYEYFMRVIPGALSRELMGELGIQAGMLGVISAGFFYAYTPMQIPAGWLCDRFGPKKCLVAAMVICTIASALFAIAHNASMAILSRFLLGFGASFAFIAPVVLAGRWVPSRYFAMTTGLIQVMGCVGAILGGAPMVHLSALFGWRSTVYGFVWIGLVFVFLFVWVLQDHPTSSALSEGGDENLVSQGYLKQVLGCSQSWWVGLASFACWAPIAIFAELWGIPFLVRAFHIPAIQAATGVAWMWVGVAIGSPLAGYLSNRIERRILPIVGCLLIGLIGALMTIYGHIQTWWIEEVALFLFGCSAAVQPITFAIMQDIHRPNVAGTAAGFNNMAVIGSGLLMQPLVGYLLQREWHHEMVNHIPFYHLANYQHALILIPVMIFLGMLATLFGIKETYCENKYP